MARIPRATKKVLPRFVQEVIEPGSIVHTDGLASYRGLETLGYQHKVSVLLGRRRTQPYGCCPECKGWLRC